MLWAAALRTQRADESLLGFPHLTEQSGITRAPLRFLLGHLLCEKPVLSL